VLLLFRPLPKLLCRLLFVGSHLFEQTRIDGVFLNHLSVTT